MRFMSFLAALMLAGPVLADDFDPTHDCIRPFKPLEFSSRMEREEFREEVRSFKECIREFVEEQEEAVRRHQEAAEDAMEEWNSFVLLELN